MIPSTLVFQARSEFEDIKEFVILDARVCAKDSRGRLLARSNRIRTTDTCVVLHTLQEKHLRELNENAYSPRLFPPLQIEYRRWHFAGTEDAFSLSLIFKSIRADAHSRHSTLTFASAGAEERGAPDVLPLRAQSTSNAYPRIHMRTCLMQMSFLSASLSRKRSSARDGVH